MVYGRIEIQSADTGSCQTAYGPQEPDFQTNFDI